MIPLQMLSGKSPSQVWGARRTPVFSRTASLPISGGWGYAQQDACIIECSNYSQGLAIEKEFVQRRILEEMIRQRLPGEEFKNIQWHRSQQALVRGDGRHYDMLIYDISGIPVKDWDALMAEYDRESFLLLPGFDEAGHQAREDACTVHLVREFWFGIDSFFGKMSSDDAGVG